jgi:hypothetical protein
MPHGADHRHRTGVDRPSQALLVESPQVFEASAPAADDDHIDPTQPLDVLERPNDLGCGLGTLHMHGKQADSQGGPAALECRENVADGRPGG